MHLQSVEMKLHNLFKMGILDKKNMKIADLDFICCREVETGQKAKNEENSDTELERFEYVETIVRIAFKNSKNKRNPSEQQPEHVRILHKDIVPNVLAIIHKQMVL